MSRYQQAPYDEPGYGNGSGNYGQSYGHNGAGGGGGGGGYGGYSDEPQTGGYEGGYGKYAAGGAGNGENCEWSAERDECGLTSFWSCPACQELDAVSKRVSALTDCFFVATDSTRRVSSSTILYSCRSSAPPRCSSRAPLTKPHRTPALL